jgi:hypothetical protein
MEHKTRIREGKEVREKEPILVSLRPIMHCNFSCKFCLSRSDKNRTEKALRTELDRFFGQLDGAKFNGIIHICGGEPFLYKEIDGLMAECSKHAVEVAALTNGSWIPYVDEERSLSRLRARLEQVKGLPNVMIRISMDSYHLDGEAGDPKGLDRLRIFSKVADSMGLVPGQHYSIQVTEKTETDAVAMRGRIEGLLGISDGSGFIRTRGMYHLGRAQGGREFHLGDPHYIALNPTTEGKLIIYAGRQEENVNVVYGGVDKLGEVIENHRHSIAKLAREGKE